MCDLCSKELETLDHVFFACDISRYVWDRIRDWMSITRRMTTLISALKWMIKEARGRGTGRRNWPARHLWNARHRGYDL